MNLVRPDQLVDCLEQMLPLTGLTEDPETFMDRVAEEYLRVLVRQGHIPLQYLATLHEDVRAEVQDLLRIRAYGFPNIAEYLRSQSRPRKPEA